MVVEDLAHPESISSAIPSAVVRRVLGLCVDQGPGRVELDVLEQRCLLRPSASEGLVEVMVCVDEARCDVPRRRAWRSSASGSSPVPTTVTKPSSTRIQPSSCSVSASSIVSTCAITSRDFIAEYRILDLVEVITPRTLDEALRMKSERPDARPIAGGTWIPAGGTNFYRARPRPTLNLAQVLQRRAGRVRTAPSACAAGLTDPGDAAGARRSRRPRSPRRRAPGRRRSATGARSAATSALPLPPATRTRRSWSRTRSWRSGARAASVRCR